MGSFLNFASWASGGAASGGRRHMRREERFATNLLATDLGDVVDISAGGVRIRTKDRPAVAVGQVVPLTIRSAQCKVVVQSRVVRVTRLGLTGRGGGEISLAFLDAKPGLRAAVAHLGRYGFIPMLKGGLGASAPSPGIGAAASAGPAGASDDGGSAGGGGSAGPRKAVDDGGGPANRRGYKKLPDYYGLLGIRPDATDDQIRKAYHDLARQHHPDKAGDSGAVGMFEAISNAYRILRDPQKRHAYDASRRAA